MCKLRPVYVKDAKAGKFNPNGARKYIDSLPLKAQVELFGREGRENYRRSKNWQEYLRGWGGFGSGDLRL